MADVEELRQQLAALTERVTANADQRQILQTLTQVVQQPRHVVRVKPPKYTGQGSVRQFLDTFAEVMEANQWDDATAGLQLKIALEGNARVGVVGATFPEVRDSLLQKYELTQDEARSTLRTLRLRPGESVHELGETTQRLIALAHPTLTEEQRMEEAILCMVEAVGDRYLKHEFRLQRPANFGEALNRIRDYQRDMGKGDRRLVQRMEIEEGGKMEELESKVSALQLQITELAVRQGKTDAALAGYATSTQDKLDLLLAQTSRYSSRPQSRACYECGDTSHMKRNCPKLAAKTPAPRRQGNASGPSA